MPTDTVASPTTLLGNGEAVLRELGGTNPRLSLKVVPRSPENIDHLLKQESHLIKSALSTGFYGYWCA